MTSPMILAAIPALNEETAIGSVVLRAKLHADTVLVIDDGSHDKTARIIRILSNGLSRITMKRNTRRGEAEDSGYSGWPRSLFS